jgi:hypothetical protein
MVSLASGQEEAAMPQNRQPPDSREIDSIARMAREGRDFYKGLAKSLRPQESKAPAESDDDGSETGQERADQQK